MGGGGGGGGGGGAGDGCAGGGSGAVAGAAILEVEFASEGGVAAFGVEEGDCLLLVQATNRMFPARRMKTATRFFTRLVTEGRLQTLFLQGNCHI
jgi:hypothetical protein